MEGEYVLVVYETHNATRTGAKSIWEFENWSNAWVFVGGGMTHHKYMTLVKKGSKAILKRTTNSGNFYYKEIIINEPLFLDYLGNASPLPEKYFILAKEKGLI